MRDDTLNHFLAELASRNPAPGGGAVGAVQTSVGAALIAMVANYTTGPRFAAVEAEVADVLEQARSVLDEGLRVAQDDATSYDGVGIARKLPKDTAEAAAARQVAIEQALQDATTPAVETLGLAEKVMHLAQVLARIGNPHLLPDVGAAAACAEAAAIIAWGNLAANVAELSDRPEKRALLDHRLRVDALGVQRAQVLEECAQVSP